MAFLTDRTLTTGVTLDDLIHIVNTSDLSQGNPAGSSYKAKISQVFDSISGYCFTNFYVSNLHSCSPLNINPLDEGNVYFGSTSGVTIDVTNSRLGIGTETPQYPLDIVGVNSGLYYDPTSLGGLTILSGNTGIPRYGIVIPSYLLKPTAGGSLGVRTWDDVTYQYYGNNGDMFLYAGNDINSLNIINGPGTLTDDSIKFYAGTYPNLNPAQMTIFGTGTTKGYVGIGTENPSEKLHVSGNTKIDGGLTANTISATTYLNLPTGYYNTTGITTSQSITWDKTYWGVSGSSNVDLILPTTTSKDGYSLIIKDEGGTAGTYRIRVTPTSGLIDGNTYIDMNINYMSLTFVARNNNWWII